MLDGIVRGFTAATELRNAEIAEVRGPSRRATRRAVLAA